jgi:hypothetical protein
MGVKTLKLLAQFAAVAAACAHATRARAEERWTPSLELATTMPVDIAERVSLEAPNRLHARASIGIMPDAYSSLINNVISGLGGFDDMESQVVHKALGRSLVFRVQAGFRPFEHLGLYFDVGYSRLSLGGDLTGSDVLALGGGAIPPQDATSPLKHYAVSSRFDLVVAEIGWEQPLASWLFVRGALGFLGAEGVSSEIKPLFAPADLAYLQAYCDQAAKYLDRLYAKHVYAPTLTLGAGVKF